MRPKLYTILTDAISKGIEHGWAIDRGHKGDDDPSDHQLKFIIEQEIWNAIDEVFDFEDEA